VRRLQVEFATRFATRNFPAVDSVEKSGGREGFIPLPEVHELKRFSNIPEYPYLRKYPSAKTSMMRGDRRLFSTPIGHLRLNSGEVWRRHDLRW
jgi:hypothetical protein